MTDTKALRELLAKATPGKWRPDWSEPDDVVIWAQVAPRRRSVFVANLGPRMTRVGAVDDAWRLDAAAIVALHNAAPALLDEVEALRMTRGGLDKWQGVISAYVGEAREAAFRDGAEAMREAAANRADGVLSFHSYAGSVAADAIRALPLPEEFADASALAVFHETAPGRAAATAAVMGGEALPVEPYEVMPVDDLGPGLPAGEYDVEEDK